MRLRDGVSYAETEYGLVLLDEHRGRYWDLNPTGATVLQKLMAGGTPEQAAEQLAEEYAVDMEGASGDVQDLIDALRSARLIEG